MTNEEVQKRVEKKFEELQESYKTNLKSIMEGTYVTEADDGDGKIESKEELLSYANKLASKAFGDKVDQKKVTGVVDNAIKDSDGDWEKAAGIVTGSFNESSEEGETEDGKELIVDEESCEECGKEPCECEKVKEEEEETDDSEKEEDETDDSDEEDKD